jgi:tetratricopeptide (TPR) repeat protein
MAAPAPFFGRDRELAAIADWIASGRSRILELVGFGGIGKSALLGAVAGTRPVVTAHDRRTLLVSVGASIGVDLARVPDDALEERLQRELAETPADLLFLDLAAAGAELAPALASLSEHHRLVLCARQVVELESAEVLRVGGLDRDAAIELCAAVGARARRAPLAPEERAALGELVDAVERIPLAVVHAATGLKRRTAAQLANELGAAVRARRSDWDGPMLAVLDDAARALDERERLLLAALARAPQPTIPLAVAEQIALELGEAAIVDRLVDACFVELVPVSARAGRAPAPAALAIHAVVGRWAVGQAPEADARDAARRAAIALSQRLVDPIGRPRAHRDRALIRACRPLLLEVFPSVERATDAAWVALAIDAGLAPSEELARRAAIFAHVRGRIDEIAPELADGILLRHAYAQRFVGNFSAAEADLATIIDTRAPISATATIIRAYAHRHRAGAAMMVGDREAGTRENDKALSLARASGDPTVLADVAIQALVLAMNDDEIARGKALAEEAYAAARQSGDDVALTWGAKFLGIIALDEGDRDGARARFVEALAASRRGHVPVMGAMVLLQCAVQLLTEGAIVRARRLVDHTCRVLRRHDVGPMLGYARGIAAIIAIELGEPRVAATWCREALPAEQIDGFTRACFLLTNAMAHRLLGEGDDWARAYDEAARSWPPLGTAADAVLAGRAPPRLPHVLARVTVDLLRKVVEQEAPRDEQTILVDEDGGAFQVGGRTIVLRHRPSLQGLLRRLIATRDGSSASAEDLILAGWPNERIGPLAAKNRLYVALTTLRRMGLSPAIASSREGYRIDASAVALRVVRPSTRPPG